MHLHAIVTLATDTPSGKAYLIPVSGGISAGQVRFSVGAGTRLVKWSAVGLLDGVQHGESRDRQIEIRFSNFMPYRGVQPGLNKLAFIIQQFGVKVERIQVIGDSAIEYTPRGPAGLTVNATANPSPARVGKRLVVSVVVKNSGDRIARSITLTTNFAGAAMRLVGPAGRPVKDLGPGESKTLSVTFVPLTPGHARLFFLVSSSANQPGTELDVASRR